MTGLQGGRLCSCVCVCVCVFKRFMLLHTPLDNPTYVKANAGCKHFDVHGGPESIPVSRYSFNAVVRRPRPHYITHSHQCHPPYR